VVMRDMGTIPFPERMAKKAGGILLQLRNRWRIGRWQAAGWEFRGR